MKKNLVILTGAGVSAESGISTFRDNGGLWDKFDPQEVASIEGWHKNPGLMLDFYNIRRKELETVRPNAAHLEIAALQDKFNVHVITQNVDNLHERAGSSNVLHLHGELTKVRPENCCNEEDGFSEKSVFIVSEADILLIVGTSLSVYPAAGLYRYAPLDIPIFIIDPEDLKVRDKRLRHIREKATAGMEVFEKEIRNINDSQ